MIIVIIVMITIIVVITIIIMITIIMNRLTIQPHILHMARSAMVILLPTKNPVDPFSVMILSKAVRYLVDVGVQELM